MSTDKPVLEYRDWNPNSPEAAVLAVASDDQRAFVFKTYTIRDVEEGFHKQIASDLEVLTVNEARDRYQFREAD